jgi:hypothetical protein
VALGRARASLVIVERGSLAIAVNPRRYGIALPQRVIRFVGRALPQPDLTLCVDGSSGVGRKSGVEVAETKRRLDACRELAGRDPDDFVAIDGSTSAETTLELALAAISERLAARQRRVRPRSDTHGDPPDGIRTLDGVGSTEAGQFPHRATNVVARL